MALAMCNLKTKVFLALCESRKRRTGQNRDRRQSLKPWAHVFLDTNRGDTVQDPVYILHGVSIRRMGQKPSNWNCKKIGKDSNCTASLRCSQKMPSASSIQVSVEQLTDFPDNVSRTREVQIVFFCCKTNCMYTSLPPESRTKHRLSVGVASLPGQTHTPWPTGLLPQETDVEVLSIEALRLHTRCWKIEGNKLRAWVYTRGHRPDLKY